MDEDRQIRFLIAPFLFYCSLLWWGYASSQTRAHVLSLRPSDLKDALSIVAAAGAATLPLGYAIGTLGVLGLRTIVWIRNQCVPEDDRQNYEAWLSREAFRHVLQKIGGPTENRGSLYVGASFDHGLLNEGIHRWLMRRWNAFHVGLNSSLALLISLAVVPIRAFYIGSVQRAPGWDYKPMYWWLITNIFLIIVFGFAAFFAWKETMGMLAFLSQPGRGAFLNSKIETPIAENSELVSRYVPPMSSQPKIVQSIGVRDRLSALNTKAYYLLVALSFLYIRYTGAAAYSLKAALTLTAFVAVAPVQDWIGSERTLEWIRRGKFTFLWLALFFTLWWVWKVS